MAQEQDFQTSVHGRRLAIGFDGEIIASGTPISGAPATFGPMVGCPSLNELQPGLVTAFFDDCLTVGGLASFTSVDDGGTGANVFVDVAGGVYGIVTAAADNDHHAMVSNGEHWIFAAGKPMWFEARVKVAEAATDDSTWWIGFTDTVTTGGMQANALGPLASYDGALFFKTPETALTLNFETSDAGTQVTSAAIALSVTDTWTRVGFYFDGISSITPYTDVGAGWVQHTAHAVTPANLAEMHLVAGIKAGPGGAAETLQVDYIKAVQVR